MIEVKPMADFFKTLADENRLRMLNLLKNEERNVGEIAALLGVTEPTVSHHMSKLREVGLVTLRQVGNERRYRLNVGALDRWKQKVMNVENLALEPDRTPPDTRWIDALDLSEEDRKVLRDYTEGGRLKRIPSKEKKLMAVLRWLALDFEPDVLYTEKEVNARIQAHHRDCASLRRDLIDFQFLRRERDGSTYWKA